MRYYKVCGLTIAADILPGPFSSFEITMNKIHEEIACDMTLLISQQPLSTETAIHKYEKVNYFNIFAMPDGSWIYEYRADSSLLWVDSSYTKMVIDPNDSPARDAISHLVSLAIQCRLVSEGIITIHAACVAKDGKAVAFTAASGTGKSTRANVWKEHLGYSWISGDRPCLDVANGLVYGAPWDGKEQIWTPDSAQICAVCEIVRSKETKREYFTESEAFAILAKQLFVPMWDSTLGATALILLKKLIRTNRVYRLYCDMTPEAAAESELLIFKDI